MMSLLETLILRGTLGFQGAGRRDILCLTRTKFPDAERGMGCQHRPHCVYRRCRQLSLEKFHTRMETCLPIESSDTSQEHTGLLEDHLPEPLFPAATPDRLGPLAWLLCGLSHTGT